METRTIGSLQVSVLGLGCNNFGRRVDEDGTRRVVDAALEAGVTFMAVPCLVLFLVMQRSYVRGFLSGAIKG